MKSYVISVSLGTGCYRHIQISSTATLYRLHKSILNAFEFEDDHAHAFFMDNQCWGRGDAYFSMRMDGDERLTKNYPLDRFRFFKGKAFKYVFDFGDEWRFQCKVLRELEEQTDIPRVIRSVGESPEQYPEAEEVWDDEDWDDENLDDEDWDEAWDEEDWEDDFISEEELEAMYALIPLKKSVIKNIQRYFDAASRLYGLIPLDKLYEIYNSQNIPVSREAFFMVAAVSAQEEQQYVFTQHGVLLRENISGDLDALELAAEYLFYEDDSIAYNQLCRKQKNKEFKILPKAEFLRYTTPSGHPVTPQYTALLAFFRQKEAKLTESVQKICHSVQNILMLDATVQEILNFLKPYGFTVDRKTELPEFEKLVKDLEQCTPKHAHRGHTPEEMFAMGKQGLKLAERNAPEGQVCLINEPAGKPALTLVGKPPRNAPCPCGSGRKYKNCCGKSI